MLLLTIQHISRKNSSEKFILMSVEQAQQWSEEYLDADEYIAIWGEPEE